MTNVKNEDEGEHQSFGEAKVNLPTIRASDFVQSEEMGTWPHENSANKLDDIEEEDDDEVESSEESDEGSDFDEDACSVSEPDSNTEIPLTEEEIEHLIDELLIVESKAAEAQELLEEESLATLKVEIKEELAVQLSGSELETAVEEELLTYKDQWQEALDKLEDESSLLQERLDDAGIELSSLFKWVEKQAPVCCSTEAWKKRTHWAGVDASEEVHRVVRKAENDLELMRPVKRHRGKLIEEGASGFLEKKVLNAAASSDGSQSKAHKTDGWESIDSLLGKSGGEEKSTGFGSRAWASVYLAATPEQAALLGLPGADEVEEIVDLEKCKNDVFTATALASEKEFGLTELQKKNLRKVGEEDDIKRARLMDRFILNHKRKKKAKVSCPMPRLPNQFAGADSTGMESIPIANCQLKGDGFLLQTDEKLKIRRDELKAEEFDFAIESLHVNSTSESGNLKLSVSTAGSKALAIREQETQEGHFKRQREGQDSGSPRKEVERVVIDIDSDEDQDLAKSGKTICNNELPMASIESDFDRSMESCSEASKSWLDKVEEVNRLDNGKHDGLEVNSHIFNSSSLEDVDESTSERFICTICGQRLKCDQVIKHPLFDVVICRPCRQFYQSGPFSKDSSGRDNECSWCANGGSVIICELCDKVFCTSCVTLNFGEEEVERILNAEEWLCYCCDPEPLMPKIGYFMEANELSSRQSSDFGNLDSDEPSVLRGIGNRRKRLRRILEDDELEESTILKQRLEKERLKRLREYANTSCSTMLSSSLEDQCVINVARDAEEEEVFAPSSIAKVLKPHQIEGVRFMWENCIESIKKVKAGDAGNGCIVAHSMGLGKTLQVITFLYTVMKKRDLGLRTALIVTPVNVLHNWPDEFSKWRPEEMKKLHVYILDETNRTLRRGLLHLWQKTGGVMMIGYSMFRTLLLGKFVKDTFEKEEISKALQNPGPDILVCDEAHMIKNKKADITQALKQVKTQRRIALTGTPLQNNLMEYYCMVDFVREGFLGRPQDFKNRFQNPIENGQHADSTEYDVRCMKERTHVLHKQLMGFVQRKGASVVEKELPKKFIYVISVRLSQLQRSLYNRFIQVFWLPNDQVFAMAKYRKSLFPTYHALSKVWNHPDLLFTAVKEDKEILSDDSMDDMLFEDGNSSDDGNAETRKDDRRNGSRNHKKTDSDSLNMIENLDWCKDLIDDGPKGILEHSGKLVLLLDILSMCSARGDKVLVFSQSIPTLNLIESFFEKVPRPRGKAGFWRKDKEWYRLDGQTKARDRQRLVKHFNDPSNSKVQCALISTKAGSLGINLQAANRVIILDGSWNPTHDIQALFRAWRFGQTKPVVVYRLLAYGTAEEKIYKRQVAKEGLAARVLDAQQVCRHSKMEELKVLFKLDEDAAETDSKQQFTDATDHDAPEDEIMTSLLIERRPEWIVRLHQHETLLIDREDEKLTLEEQALAWEKFRRITENTDVEWVRVNSEVAEGTHVQNSWANTSQGAPFSSCSVKFHAELLASSAIKNNEYIKCDSCQQCIGWEHIVKGRQIRGIHS